jgi:hypothetical protein
MAQRARGHVVKAMWRGQPSHQANIETPRSTIHTGPHRRSNDRGRLRLPLGYSRNGHRVVLSGVDNRPAKPCDLMPD